jgi:hypothetical protein
MLEFLVHISSSTAHSVVFCQNGYYGRKEHTLLKLGPKYQCKCTKWHSKAQKSLLFFSKSKSCKIPAFYKNDLYTLVYVLIRSIDHPPFYWYARVPCSTSWSKLHAHDLVSRALLSIYMGEWLSDDVFHRNWLWCDIFDENS